MKKMNWYWYGLKYVLKTKNISLGKYCRRNEISVEEANTELEKMILSGKPFFAGRVGFFELASMRAYEFENKKNYAVTTENLYNCAGFFPKDEELGKQFLMVMKDSFKELDYLGYSGEPYENYFIDKYSPKNLIVSHSFDALQPWRFKTEPWSRALKGKKVLIVHPFENTIKEQYKKRDRLFDGTDILPEFELITYKALQTTGDLKDERFATWFEALDYMTEDILKIDFDIALLGCGAYGFPLAARIKRAGKQAVHMGGTSQLLFGIMGKRWDGTGPNSETKKMSPDLIDFYNEYWTYPLDEDTPSSAGKVEYGPYWK